jgi:hypothetical protein
MTLIDELEAIEAETPDLFRALAAEDKSLIGKTDQCRCCRQWYSKLDLDIDLYGYCSVSCMEEDYANFRHFHLARRLTVVSSTI